MYCVFTIMPIYGTRPEAIKMAPIVKALQASPQFECVVTVTGQHREMLDQVNDIFDITPDHDLNIIQPRQTLNGVLTRTVEGLDAIFAENAPDAVVVQGDTTTSTAGAIAAFYRGIPVIHAEAGLRSFDLFSPFPEEANRKMTSQITSLHLAPTSTSKENLLREALPEEDIVVTGNTVIDALLHTVEQKLPFSDPQLEEIASSGRRVLLVTTHRRENQGEAMRGVGRALARIAQAEPELTIVLPVHRNPVVREAVLPAIEGLPNVVVTEPLEERVLQRMLPGDRTYVTSLNLGNYMRTTADRRLVFGGRARFAISSPTSDAKSGDVLKAGMQKMFPHLGNVGIDYCWGGLVDMTADRLPHAGEQDGVFYSLGYSGHGTQMSVWMGRVMADLLTEKANDNPWQRSSWPAVPGYFGKPWFLPVAGLYYKAKDRFS